MARKEHELLYFTVRGTGDFPFDMLRYDGAYPARSEDASELYNEPGSRRMRRVVLASRNPFAPTIDRWRSFTWGCSGPRTSIPDPEEFEERQQRKGQSVNLLPHEKA
jgi:hypothetical protein